MLESVRLRLTLWYTVVLALVLVTLALAGYFIFWQSTVKRTDSDLAELSSAFLTTLMAEAKDQPSPDALKSAAQVAINEHRFRDHIFTVLDPAGGLFITSLDLPSSRSAPEDVSPNFLTSTSFRKFAEASAGVDHLYRNIAGGRHGYRGYARHFPVNGQTYTLVVLRSLHPQKEMLEEITTAFAGAIPIAILLASAGGYFLARKSLAPVAAMSAQAGRIGAANLHERLAVQNEKDELGHLAQSFNHLLDRLDQSFERQRCFMADASHELRTPVAILRGEAEVALSRATRSPEEYRDSLTILHNEAQRLTHIVEDLFTLTRADAGQYPLELRSFYLDELLLDCAHSVRTLALAKHIALIADAPPELPLVGDEALLRRMILNLLDNAIKHTPAGGRVTLKCCSTGGEYALSITDTGTGIPFDLQPRIFERFFRADKARSRGENNGGGAGLGLSIARWIAEAHHGRLELTRSDATGSTFTAYLPATPSPAASSG
jgi:two-component system OmpR family sensor kinase